MSNLALTYTVLIILFIFIVSGCQNKQSDSTTVRYSIPHMDSCRDEPDHKYLISEPEFVSAGQEFPLIIVIDPHGNGNLAVEKFTHAMGDIPALIAGSEKLKNNYTGFELSLSHLYNDVLAKYPADPERVILAGFSGGARMAYAYGMRYTPLGIIMFGAGPGPLNDQMKGNRIYAVSGTRDFNFMEQYLPPFSSITDDLDYTADFFRGKHEWPPSKNIYESVAYCLKDEAEFSKSIPTEISEKLMHEYDSLLVSNNLFFAGKALEKAWAFTTDSRNKTRILRVINGFKNTPGWNDCMNQYQSYLQKELKLKNAYVSKLADPDTSWWKNEINSLHKNLISCSDPVQEDFLYRLQGFIGIILYSQINTLLQNEEPGRDLANLLVIYEYAEPESPDLLKFKSHFRQLIGQ